MFCLWQNLNNGVITKNPGRRIFAAGIFYTFFIREIKKYNSAKDVPHFYKWGLGLITGGEHISRLVEMPQRKVCLWQTLIEGIINKLRMILRKFDDNVGILIYSGGRTLIFGLLDTFI